MLYAYEEKDSKRNIFCCTGCAESGVVMDVDLTQCMVLTSHPKQGQLVKCDYCNQTHVLVVPQRPKVVDKKVILSLSIPESLKNRILRRVATSGKNINALCYPLVMPILEKEFPDVVADSEEPQLNEVDSEDC